MTYKSGAIRFFKPTGLKFQQCIDKVMRNKLGYSWSYPVYGTWSRATRHEHGFRLVLQAPLIKDIPVRKDLLSVFKRIINWLSE